MIRKWRTDFGNDCNINLIKGIAIRSTTYFDDLILESNNEIVAYNSLKNKCLHVSCKIKKLHSHFKLCKGLNIFHSSYLFFVLCRNERKCQLHLSHKSRNYSMRSRRSQVAEKSMTWKLWKNMYAVCLSSNYIKSLSQAISTRYARIWSFIRCIKTPALSILVMFLTRSM